MYDSQPGLSTGFASGLKLNARFHTAARKGIEFLLTLKFIRRRKGFKATPMDFLILVIALVVPNLPDPTIQSFHMGFLAVKIFSFEVRVGELRGQMARPGVGTFAALLVVAARGLF